jgi:hypothetical protein
MVLSIPYASEARSDEAVVSGLASSPRAKSLKAWYHSQMIVAVEYHTAERPDVKRSYRVTQTLNLSLPLAVNVQDFFRPDW